MSEQTIDRLACARVLNEMATHRGSWWSVKRERALLAGVAALRKRDVDVTRLLVQSAWDVGQRNAVDTLAAKARRFNLDKNEVVGRLYVSDDMTAIEALLCDICNAFLDDICPEWRVAGDIAEHGYVPETAKAIQADPVERSTRTDDSHDPQKDEP